MFSKMIYSAIKVFVIFALLSSFVKCRRKNVLFLVSDDMRPQLSAYYGKDFPSPVHPKMHTPEIDRLASRSLLLKRAYVQMALCSPSRTSLLTGRRPDTTHVTDMVHYFRIYGGNYTTIPQYFKEHGYHTEGIGKIFHPGMRASGNDDPISWSVPSFHAPETWTDGNSWRAVPDDLLIRRPLRDMILVQRGLERLRVLAKQTDEKPFFLAFGFKRPHLPFIAPQSFFDLYPLKDIRTAPNQYAPAKMPEIAWNSFHHFRTTYNDIRKTGNYGNVNETFSDSTARNLRRAYYASISYVDFLLGNLTRELKNLGIENDTIISFWGDHGWQLGEHSEWCKETNFDLAVHAPMMVHIPGVTDSGISSDRLVEFVDLFPTLTEAAGFPPLPLCPPGKNSTFVKTCREGTSMIPLIQNPKRAWKKAAFSQYPRMDETGGIIMGYSMRTDRYRYTVWTQYLRGPDYRPLDLSSFSSRELYDHQNDPEENFNVVDSTNYKKIVDGLHKQIQAGWRAAQPKV